MPLVVWAKQKDKIDGSMKAKVYTFIEKLQRDDTSPGLHIEPMQKPLDDRVRTGRVDLNFRAVLFKVSLDAIPTYFYYGAWPHKEAIDIARSSRMRVNDVNGVLEVIRGTPQDLETAPETTHDDSGQATTDATSATAITVEQDRLGETPTVKTQVKNEREAGIASEPEVVVWANPLSGDFNSEALVADLGLDGELVGRAATAETEDILLEVLDDAPEWQANALLEIAAGATVEEVKEKLALEGYVNDPEISEEEKIKKALEHPASRMQFTFIGDNSDELKQVIEGSDFEAWRTFLHPEQRVYSERRYNGSFRLSGGAGTGKTVVLVHRARMLANANPQSRSVLTTYTTTLAQSLDINLAKLDAGVVRADRLGQPGVFIGGIDSLVSKVVQSASDTEQRDAMKAVFGIEGAIPGKVLDDRASRYQWEASIRESDHGLDAELANPTFLQQEYETVILPNFITAKDAYLKVPRAGRGTALNRSKRLGVWKAIEHYRYFNRIEMTCSFVEQAHLATAVLRNRAAQGIGRLADHVLIDESQDLHAGHWLFLREITAVGADDLFIAEDSHQRIYGQKVPLSRFGISIVGRSRRLTLNYRTTQQNLAYALGLLEGVSIADMEDEEVSSHAYTSARSGPKPEEKSARSFAGELDAVANSLKQWKDENVSLETVGILVRANFQIAKVINGLEERGLRARTTSARNEPGVPVVMTMHRSKGMEFTHVILTGVSDDALPVKNQVNGLAPAERADALARERSLLYVASTRARDGLVVTWSGNPSELLGKN